MSDFDFYDENGYVDDCLPTPSLSAMMDYLSVEGGDVTRDFTQAGITSNVKALIAELKALTPTDYAPEGEISMKKSIDELIRVAEKSSGNLLMVRESGDFTPLGEIEGTEGV